VTVYGEDLMAADTQTGVIRTRPHDAAMQASALLI
jgi:hypothetical protein